MANLHFQGDVGVSEGFYRIGLSLVEFKEDNVTIVYAPALDLSGYGYSAKEAKNSFNVALVEFVRYTHNKKTFNEVLKELGWKIKGKKNPKILPPLNSDLVKKNPFYNEIINSKSYKVYSENVSLAL